MTNFSNLTISVVDTNPSDGSAFNTVVKTIPVGFQPNGIAVTPDGKFVWASMFGNNQVLKIDTSANSVVLGVPVGTGPGGVAITPDGRFAYVANIFSNTVSVIDTMTNMQGPVVTLGLIQRVWPSPRSHLRPRSPMWSIRQPTVTTVSRRTRSCPPPRRLPGRADHVRGGATSCLSDGGPLGSFRLRSGFRSSGP